MRILRRGEGSGAPPPTPTFTGDVLITPIQRDDRAAVNSVTFLAGARTFWHTHEHGQLLLVTAGTGRVAADDGIPQHVQRGDLVWAEPGERHWHGAEAATDMTHLAVSLGRTSWLGEVADDPGGPAPC